MMAMMPMLYLITHKEEGYIASLFNFGPTRQLLLQDSELNFFFLPQPNFKLQCTNHLPFTLATNSTTFICSHLWPQKILCNHNNYVFIFMIEINKQTIALTYTQIMGPL